MTALFERLLEMSLTTAYVVALVVVLRLLLCRLPKVYSYALWSVVFFRMALPFSFTSRASVVPPAVMELPPAPVQTITPVVVQATPGAGLPPPAGAVPLSPSYILSLTDLLAWVWLAGLVVLLGYSLLSYLLLRRRVGDATLLPQGGYYTSPQVQTPFVLGLWRPRVYLPQGLPEDAVRHILCHEQVHIARRDTLIKPLCFLLCCVHWFNPLCWLAFVLCCQDMEMSCDEAVMKRLGLGARADYADALLAMAVRRHRLAPVPLAFGESGVGQRIKSLLRYKKPAVWVTAGCIVAVVVAVVCLATNPVANPAASQEEMDQLPIPTPTPQQHLDLLLGSGNLAESWGKASLPNPDGVVLYYTALAGLDSRIPRSVPGAALHPQSGDPILPAAYVERVGKACFGVSSDYLRQSSFYYAPAQGYTLGGLGSVAACTVVEVSQSDQGDTQIDFDMTWDGVPYAQGLLTVENLPDGGWRYASLMLPQKNGLSRQETELLSQQELAYRQGSPEERLAMWTDETVSCKQFRHLWWEETIPMAMIERVGQERFNGWVAERRESHDARRDSWVAGSYTAPCLSIYDIAAEMGWTTQQLAEIVMEAPPEGVEYLADRVQIRGQFFGLPTKTREQYLAQALRNGLTQEQAQSLEELSIPWKEIARMTPDQAAEKLAGAKELHTQNQLAELYLEWQDWGQLEKNNPSYVRALPGVTVNLASVDRWVEDFRNRRESELYVLAYASPQPMIYRLYCDGSPQYRIDYYTSYKSQETQGNYTASIVYKRAQDYVFGGPEAAQLKYPLQVVRQPEEAQVLETTGKLDETKGQAVVDAAWSAKLRREALPRPGTALSGEGIRLPAQQPTKQPAVRQAQLGERLLVFGEPYQSVRLEEGGDNEVYAVSEDGKRVLLQSMVDGRWIPLEDKDELTITAR